MGEAIFVEGLTKTYAGKTVVDFWHNPADWSYAWRCRTLHNPCCMLLPLGISIHEDLGNGVYQVYVEIDGKLVPYVAVDSATGNYHG